jgi:hypothetical protein
MAKSQRRIRLTESVDFSIDIPAASQVITPDGSNMYTVQMDDNGSTDSFAVNIYAFSPSTGIGTLISGPSAFGAPATGTNKRTLSVLVGPPDPMSTGNNRVIQVEDESVGRIIGHPFRVAASGSPRSASVKKKRK